MTPELILRCNELLERGIPFVSVTMVDGTGSTPADVGARMIVTADGVDVGTVGGGRVEARAIEHARGMLDAFAGPVLLRWNLNTDIGMTCGGRVSLFFEPFEASNWDVSVFGAGHVAQALARLLLMLPCRVRVIDPRPEWIDRLPAGVEAILADDPSARVADLPDHSSIVCMTKGHATDRPVLAAIARAGKPFPFVGVIGSRSKAGALRRELRGEGIELDFECPIGLPIGSNHPGEIAVSIAARLMQVRDQESNEVS